MFNCWMRRKHLVAGGRRPSVFRGFPCPPYPVCNDNLLAAKYMTITSYQPIRAQLTGHVGMNWPIRARDKLHVPGNGPMGGLLITVLAAGSQFVLSKRT